MDQHLPREEIPIRPARPTGPGPAKHTPVVPPEHATSGDTAQSKAPALIAPCKTRDTFHVFICETQHMEMVLLSYFRLES